MVARDGSLPHCHNWRPRRGCGQRSDPVASAPASAQVPDHLAKLEALCAAPLGFTSTGQTAGELYLSVNGVSSHLQL